MRNVALKADRVYAKFYAIFSKNIRTYKNLCELHRVCPPLNDRKNQAKAKAEFSLKSLLFPRFCGIMPLFNLIKFSVLMVENGVGRNLLRIWETNATK